MILINKSIFNDYMEARYGALRASYLSDKEDSKIRERAYNKQYEEFVKIKGVIRKKLEDGFQQKSFETNKLFQLKIIYNENDDGGYYTRDIYESDAINTDSLPKLYYHLLFNILDEKLCRILLNICDYRSDYDNPHNIPSGFCGSLKDINLIDDNYKYVNNYYTYRDIEFSKSGETDAIENLDNIIFKYNKTEDDIKWLDSLFKINPKTKVSLIDYGDGNFDLLELLGFFFKNYNVSISECNIITL